MPVGGNEAVGFIGQGESNAHPFGKRVSFVNGQGRVEVGAGYNRFDGEGLFIDKQGAVAITAERRVEHNCAAAGVILGVGIFNIENQLQCSAGLGGSDQEIDQNGVVSKAYTQGILVFLGGQIAERGVKKIEFLPGAINAQQGIGGHGVGMTERDTAVVIQTGCGRAGERTHSEIAAGDEAVFQLFGCGQVAAVIGKYPGGNSFEQTTRLGEIIDSLFYCQNIQ